MKIQRILPALFMLILFSSSHLLQATTISPFPNLGEMAKASDAVVFAKAIENYTVVDGDMSRFRTSLEVITKIKGVLNESRQFDIQNYHLKIGDLERMIWGDLELREGENYLLFLHQLDNGLWQGQMLSYAAFEEHTKNGVKLLVPFDLGAEVQTYTSPGQEQPEQLAIYKSRDLIEMLLDIVGGTGVWNKTKVATSLPITSIQAGTRTTLPSHCTSIGGTPYPRWPDFGLPSLTDLPVWYGSGLDPGCSNTVTQVTNALSNIATSYLGVTLTNSGTHSYVPTCSGGEGATDCEFTSWVSANLGGDRHLLIQFDDPCSEIPDLVACSGTLAFGGFYWYGSTHTNGGCSWRNAAYGYVVVNNGTGTCQCPGTDYEIMLVHELTHALGIGHIAAGEGAANMNPSCCNAITSLDEECLDFTYPPSDLPVEVISFTGKAKERTITLDWISASEINNAFYSLEKRNDAEAYERLAEINGLGNSLLEQKYQYTDEQPLIGTNYYRLSQTDFDGTNTVIGDVAIDYYDKVQIQIRPNPVTDNILHVGITAEAKVNTSIAVFDINGNNLLQKNWQVERGKNQLPIDLAELPKGLYFLRVIQNNKTEALRFMKF